MNTTTINDAIATMPPAAATLATQKNLYLDRRVIFGAESYILERKKTRRGYSFSQLVQELLVRELRKQGIKLPPEFYGK